MATVQCCQVAMSISMTILQLTPFRNISFYSKLLQPMLSSLHEQMNLPLKSCRSNFSAVVQKLHLQPKAVVFCFIYREGNKGWKMLSTINCYGLDWPIINWSHKFSYALNIPIAVFLCATKRLYNWLCPSVGWLVCLLVTHSFDDPQVSPYWPTWPCSFCQKKGKQLTNMNKENYKYKREKRQVYWSKRIHSHVEQHFQ